eukprot:9822798-Karenia_brevis.AAC.1
MSWCNRLDEEDNVRFGTNLHSDAEGALMGAEKSAADWADPYLLSIGFVEERPLSISDRH